MLSNQQSADSSPGKSQDARSARSQATCDKIIRVALKLFADRGLEGVSLNDINKAAGQRNKNATHYHFGSKDGLLQAILDRYEPRLAESREAMLDEYESQGNLTTRNAVRALLRPFAELIHDETGGRDFIRFNAHIIVNRTMIALNMAESGLQLVSVERLTKVLQSAATPLPPALQLQRGLMFGMLMTHSMAEHIKMMENLDDDVDWSVNTELFLANLEDSLIALLETPPSEDTLAALP